jgi:23S rRNA pseudouridine955/2504/2580 synthase
MNSENTKFMPVEHYSVTNANHGQRLDNFLLTKLSGVPKTRIYQMIRKGEVRINKKRANVFARIHEEDIIRIPPFTTNKVTSLDTPLKKSTQEMLESSIIFEDERLLVINKPSGLAVHGGSNINLGLIEAVRRMRPKAKLLELVHRLDRETSGLIMIAKKRSMLTYLHECLRLGRIHKSYLALVPGLWPDVKIIEEPLLKREASLGGKKVIVHPEGKPATTRVKVVQRYPNHTLLKVSPLTGRTHQIRVHLAHIGHSIIGDDRYGDKNVNSTAQKLGLSRLFLHACHLTIPLPGQENSLRLEADLPNVCIEYCKLINSI